MSTFPEVDAFVQELRAHYHAVGLADADEQADNYANALVGMAAATIGNPPGADHFARVLAAMRRQDLTLAEKRQQLAELFANTKPVQH